MFGKSVLLTLFLSLVMLSSLTANITLSTFKATVTAEFYVDVEWITNGETSMLGYQVFRGENDAFNHAIEITTDLIPATNTSDTQLYIFTDEDTEMYQTYYYWLHAIELNLNAELYGPVDVTVEHFQGGSGTLEDPYLIASAAHLNSVRYYLGEEHSGNHYLQTGDLDLGVSPWNEGEGWDPIGWYIDVDDHLRFHGNYNGNGFIVDGLYIDRIEGEHQGLFGYINDAVIKNLGVTNAELSGYHAVGIIAGSARSSLITNCFSSGTAYGELSIGGIAGMCFAQSVISKCHNYAAVYGTAEIGGITGILASSSSIDNSCNRGSISGYMQIGGLTGSLVNEASITNSYSFGSVTAMGYFGGGLVGMSMINSTVENSYWDTIASGINNSDGGSPRTTTEMTYPYDANTYEGWDFTGIWEHDSTYELNLGYPLLRWHDYVSAEKVTEPSLDRTEISNYPNPFNPETTIFFTVSQEKQIVLSIYNIRGQKVRTLVNSILQIGEHHVHWNGKDDNGRSVSSGVYFTKLESETGVDVHRMMLLK